MNSPAARNQYIETLIKLVEQNNDTVWTATFLLLRQGHPLPGGGAGSLNDWGPTYTNHFENAWYTKLYAILRFLHDQDLRPESILDYKFVKSRDKFGIIRCLMCDKSYQHPDVFESQVAYDYYATNFVQYAESGRLTSILRSENSYASAMATEFRNWLEHEYALHEIKIYDFVKNKYVCPHCGRSKAAFEHDCYICDLDTAGHRRLSLHKRNATWEDLH